MMSKEVMKMTLLYEYKPYEPKCTVSGLAKVYAGLWGRWDIFCNIIAFISIVHMLWGNQNRIFVVKVEEGGSVDEARDVLVQRFLATLSLLNPAQILLLFFFVSNERMLRFVLLTNASRLLGKAYTAVLNTLVTLQNDYLDSKASSKIFISSWSS